jgi:hypothetical protein
MQIFSCEQVANLADEVGFHVFALEGEDHAPAVGVTKDAVRSVASIRNEAGLEEQLLGLREGEGAIVTPRR